MKYLILLLWLGVLIGNIFRINLGKININIIDLLILPCLIYAILRYIFSINQNQNRNIKNFYINLIGALSIISFSILILVSTLISFYKITSISLLESLGYIFRFYLYLSCIFIYSVLNKKERTFLEEKWYDLVFLLSFLGFIQLKLLPSMEVLALKSGWDPHVGRLVSTWLDPNLLGGFLAFSLPIFLDRLLLDFKSPKKILYFIVICLAILLTFSRSTWITAFLGIFIYSLIKQPKIILIIIMIGFLSMSHHRVRERIISPITHILGYEEDKTGSYRINSWKEGINLWKDHKFIGYGTVLKDIRLSKGNIWLAEQNSGRGVESSWIFILAISGVIGLSLFLMSFLVFLNNLNTHGISYLAGGISLIFHAQIVNSLFYGLLIISILFWATPKNK